MRKFIEAVRFGFCGVAVILAASSAHASISGSVYTNPSGGDVPVAGSFPGAGTTEIATFTANQIDFDSNVGGYTVGGFLGTLAGNVSNVHYLNGFTSGKDLNNTLFEFTGTALFTNGKTYSDLHDDGVRLYIAGNQVVSSPGPTSASNSPYTFTGTTGTYSFDFLYGETSGAPAVFITTLAATTPEPGYFAFMGIGVPAILYLRRRRKTTNQ